MKPVRGYFLIYEIIFTLTVFSYQILSHTFLYLYNDSITFCEGNYVYLIRNFTWNKSKLHFNPNFILFQIEYVICFTIYFSCLKSETYVFENIEQVLRYFILAFNKYLLTNFHFTFCGQDDHRKWSTNVWWF